MGLRCAGVSLWVAGRDSGKGLQEEDLVEKMRFELRLEGGGENVSSRES